jgi:hypothetical protein
LSESGLTEFKNFQDYFELASRLCVHGSNGKVLWTSPKARRFSVIAHLKLKAFGKEDIPVRKSTNQPFGNKGIIV